MYAKISMKW